MKAPLVIGVTERHELGGHYATVTFKVPIADLRKLIAYCDCSEVGGAGLEDALAASDRAELEQPPEHTAPEASPSSPHTVGDAPAMATAAESKSE